MAEAHGPSGEGCKNPPTLLRTPSPHFWERGIFQPNVWATSLTVPTGRLCHHKHVAGVKERGLGRQTLPLLGCVPQAVPRGLPLSSPTAPPALCRRGWRPPSAPSLHQRPASLVSRPRCALRRNSLSVPGTVPCTPTAVGLRVPR